jgi:steroid 5-alpha reductase family enzyme
VSAPVWFINSRAGGILGIWDFVGLLTFGTGFLIEVFSDAQLVAFKKDPANRGKLLTTGMWSLSRHPNYFGESLVWWGLALYALSLPSGWMTMVSPVIMTLLLRYVSGVPMLEKKFESHPDWPAYKETTAPFIPYIKSF